MTSKNHMYIFQTFDLFILLLPFLNEFSNNQLKNSDPFCIVNYDIRWGTTSWTDGTILDPGTDSANKVILLHSYVYRTKF